MTPSPTALITGGTAGIGGAAASALAARGYRLLVTGRETARGRAAEHDLLQGGAPAATFLATDHASLEATDALVEQVHNHVKALDVLIANVGAMPSTRTRTAEGLDLEIALDVVGVIALIDGLLALLTAAPRARIVLVTSDAATRFPAQTDQDPWQLPPGPVRAYSRAKRWKLDLAAALAQELHTTNVTVHAASPGPAWTPMTRAMTRHSLGAPLPLWWLIRAVQRTASPGRTDDAARRSVSPTSMPQARSIEAAAPPRIPSDPAQANNALTTARHLTTTRGLA